MRDIDPGLTASEEDVRRTLDQVPLLVWTAGTDKLCTWFNAAWLSFTGRTMEQELGSGWAEGVHPDDFARCLEVYEKAFDARQQFSMDYRLRRADGTYRWIRDLGAPRFGPGGRFEGFLGTCLDIHDDLAARERASARHDTLRQLIRQSPVALAMFDREMRYVAASWKWSLDFGLGDRSVEGLSHYALFPDLPQRWKDVHRRCLEGTALSAEEDPFPRADGRTQWVRWQCLPWRKADESIGGLIIYSEDVTARVEARNQLAESEARFRELAQAIDEVFWLFDAGDLRPLYVSPAYERVWGRPLAGVHDDPREWIDAVAAEHREKVAGAVAAARDAGSAEVEFQLRRPDGALRTIHARFFRVPRPHQGLRRVAGAAEDVTGKRELEDRLRQAQKLETLGLLASSIAHDFNNYLTVVGIDARLLQSRAAPGDDALALVQEIVDATDRASLLTQRLQLFARRRGAERQPVDVNAEVERTTQLVRRLFPPDIAVETQLAPDVGSVLVEGSGVDQIVLNLAINARDVMPQGGRLVLTTVREGRWVEISVRDTGPGIPAALHQRIFEPFFTTKAEGRGTGLGLATVRDLAQRAGGEVLLESAPGKGTTFRVRLPASASNAPADPPPPARPRGTVLLVENEADVRAAGRRVLETAGLSVLEAGSGSQALDLWRARRGEIALVISEAALPGEPSGEEVLRRIRAESPSLPLVCISGSGEEVAPAAEAPGHALAFRLAKPFTAEQLAGVVQSQLEAVSAPAR